MKTISKLLIAVLATLLAACTEGDRLDMNDGDKVIFTAHVQYITDGKTKNDIGASLYLFEDFVDTQNYTFKDGKFVHNTTGLTKDHQYQGTANDAGMTNVYVLYGKTYTAVIQSAAYPKQYKQTIHKLDSNQSQIGLGQIVFKEKVE